MDKCINIITVTIMEPTMSNERYLGMQVFRIIKICRVPMPVRGPAAMNH
jgi:hypothetical protein